MTVGRGMENSIIRTQRISELTKYLTTGWFIVQTAAVPLYNSSSVLQCRLLEDSILVYLYK